MANKNIITFCDFHSGRLRPRFFKRLAIIGIFLVVIFGGLFLMSKNEIYLFSNDSFINNYFVYGIGIGLLIIAVSFGLEILFDWKTVRIYLGIDKDICDICKKKRIRFLSYPISISSDSWERIDYKDYCLDCYERYKQNKKIENDNWISTKEVQELLTVGPNEKNLNEVFVWLLENKNKPSTISLENPELSKYKSAEAPIPEPYINTGILRLYWNFANLTTIELPTDGYVETKIGDKEIEFIRYYDFIWDRDAIIGSSIISKKSYESEKHGFPTILKIRIKDSISR